MEFLNDFWSNLKFNFFFLIFSRVWPFIGAYSFTELLALKEKKTDTQKPALAVRGGNCPLEIEANHRMAGK